MSDQPVKQWERDGIRVTVLRVLAEHFHVHPVNAQAGPETAIHDETRIYEDLNADDLDGIELLMELEEAFEACFPDAVINESNTPREIIDKIADQLSRASNQSTEAT